MKELKPENTGKNEEIRGADGKFLPGVSGNPAGKPKGSKHITTLFMNALKSMKNEKGEDYESLFIKRILTETVIKGKGDMLRHAWDHIDGKPQEKLDLTSDGDKIGTIADDDIARMAAEISKKIKKEETEITD